MTPCPQCGSALSWRIRLDGFTLSQRERGIIGCPHCGTQLELTPASGLRQVLLVAITAVPTIMILRYVPTPSRFFSAVAVLVAVTVASFAGYLWLGRYRIRSSFSLLTPKRSTELR